MFSFPYSLSGVLCVSGSLRYAVSLSTRLNETAINYFAPFRPMLGQRATVEQVSEMYMYMYNVIHLWAYTCRKLCWDSIIFPTWLCVHVYVQLSWIDITFPVQYWGNLSLTIWEYPEFIYFTILGCCLAKKKQTKKALCQERWFCKLTSNVLQTASIPDTSFCLQTVWYTVTAWNYMCTHNFLREL